STASPWKRRASPSWSPSSSTRSSPPSPAAPPPSRPPARPARGEPPLRRPPRLLADAEGDAQLRPDVRGIVVVQEVFDQIEVPDGAAVLVADAGQHLVLAPGEVVHGGVVEGAGADVDLAARRGVMGEAELVADDVGRDGVAVVQRIGARTADVHG